MSEANGGSAPKRKMSRGTKWLIALNVLILAAFLWAGWATDWSFKLADREYVAANRARKAHADCILQNMRNVSDRVAVFAIRKACDEKYPVPKDLFDKFDLPQPSPR